MVAADGIQGKINATMTRSMVEMKEPATPFRKFLNQDNIYVSPTLLGLVDTCIIGFML
jgi:hypothetical protein